DASTYGNHAQTYGGPSWVPGVSGQALRFSSSSELAAAPDHESLDITGAITLATWVKPERIANHYLIKKAEMNTTDGYELALTNGTVFFRFNQATSGNTYRLTSSSYAHPSDGSTWVHLAATFDGSTIRLYIDGVENSSNQFSNPPPIAVNALELMIGAGSQSLRGAMDDVRIYNTALGPEDVQELAAIPPPATPLLNAPEDMASGVSNAPVLSWNPAEGAGSYRVQVSEEPAFDNTLFDRVGVTETSVQASPLASSTQYFW